MQSETEGSPVKADEGRDESEKIQVYQGISQVVSKMRAWSFDVSGENEGAQRQRKVLEESSLFEEIQGFRARMKVY